MSYYDYVFEATLERFGVGKTKVIWYNVVFLPKDIESDLPFDIYPRLRVDGEISDIPVRGAWIPTGDDRRYFIVSAILKKQIGVRLGDVIEMRFNMDDQNHVDVPQALLGVINNNSKIKKRWDQLTPGRRRGLAYRVQSAKTLPTQNKRIAEVLSEI